MVLYLYIMYSNCHSALAHSVNYYCFLIEQRSGTLSKKVEIRSLPYLLLLVNYSFSYQQHKEEAQLQNKY